MKDWCILNLSSLRDASRWFLWTSHQLPKPVVHRKKRIVHFMKLRILWWFTLRYLLLGAGASGVYHPRVSTPDSHLALLRALVFFSFLDCWKEEERKGFWRRKWRHIGTSYIVRGAVLSISCDNAAKRGALDLRDDWETTAGEGFLRKSKVTRTGHVTLLGLLRNKWTVTVVPLESNVIVRHLKKKKKRGNREWIIESG